MDPISLFKKSRRTNPNDFYYRKGYNGDNPDGETSELILAKNSNNPNIGDRNVYRFINPVSNDTTIVAFPKNTYASPNSVPAAVYNNTSPNWRRLNALFDMIKNSRNLDNYGTYFNDSKYIYK